MFVCVAIFLELIQIYVAGGLGVGYILGGIVDYASIILGVIGASEHQELCWHNRNNFMISWPTTLQTCNPIRPSAL